MSSHFCVVITGYLQASPVHLDALSKSLAERSRRWQLQGQPTPAQFVVCRLHPDRRGVMVRIDSGLEVPVSKGSWTDEAWERFLKRYWKHNAAP